jgi:hypothetical protein
MRRLLLVSISRCYLVSNGYDIHRPECEINVELHQGNTIAESKEKRKNGSPNSPQNLNEVTLPSAHWQLSAGLGTAGHVSSHCRQYCCAHHGLYGAQRDTLHPAEGFWRRHGNRRDYPGMGPDWITNRWCMLHNCIFSS